MEQKNKKKIINPNSEDFRIEEEITSHMEENGYDPDCEEHQKDYGNWLDSFINTQKGLLK